MTKENNKSNAIEETRHPKRTNAGSSGIQLGTNADMGTGVGTKELKPTSVVDGAIDMKNQHVKERSSSQAGDNRLGQSKPDLVRNEDRDKTILGEAYNVLDADTSMAVNTGMPLIENSRKGTGDFDEHQHQGELGMKTPQKDLLSPPAVTRKIPGSDAKQKLTQTKLFREIPVVKLNPRMLTGDVVEEAPPFKMNYNINTREKDIATDTEDTNSLISEYGSEIGEVKIRLEDIRAMDALAEEENENVEMDTDRRNYEGESRREQRDGGEDGISAEGLKEEQFSQNRNILRQKTCGSHSNDDENDDEFSQEVSVDSIDLVSQHDGLELENEHTATTNLNESTPVRVLSPVSKEVGHTEIEPSTPIGAVSAALRRFGNGVSHMTRCNKSPPDQDNSKKTWLSPRYGNQDVSDKKGSIQQPRFGGSPWVRKNSRGVSRSGITACLSFDPECGKRPYGFINSYDLDSPPSSPLPTHRKSRSWGSGGSDYFVGSLKDLYESGNTQLLDPQSMKTSRISSFQKPSVRILEGEWNQKCEKAENNITSPPRATCSSSPKPTFNRKRALFLQSPHRVGDIEREDALDLLALFVERSVAFHEHSSTQAVSSDPTKSTNVNSCLPRLREIIKTHFDDVSNPSLADIMEVLDSLEHSHTYAMEMKQAAQSAATWLKAIDRGKVSHHSNCNEFLSDKKIMQMSKDELISLVHESHMEIMQKNEVNNRLDQQLSLCRAEIGRLKTVSRNEASFLSPNKSILDTEGDDDSSSSSSNTVCSRNEFPDNSSAFVDMTITSQSRCENDESCLQSNDTAVSMADAKKEILLLKAELEETNRMLKTMEEGIQWPKNGSKIGKESSFITREGRAQNPINGDLLEEGTASEIHKEIPDALDEIDNKNPAEISAALIETPLEKEGNTSILMDALKEELDAYVAAIRESDSNKINTLSEEVKKYESAMKTVTNPDEKMINVRMLNAENFVTEWDKLSPLPPLPDHDLRSPIVTEILSHWTTDIGTQESLLLWVEEIIDGQACNDIPPLKLSGLDHQVREGFKMHILPLLLRRSDIHVEVATRALRKTSYDMSVTISRSRQFPQRSIEFGSPETPISTKMEMNLTSKNPHVMAFKASGNGVNIDYSGEKQTTERSGFRRYIASALDSGSVTHSATTEPISNNIAASPRLVNNHATSPMLVEEEQPPQQQGGIVAGALNAMGGLLSRRKGSVNYDADALKKNSSMATPSSHFSDTSSDMQEDSQSYHRVVSAPPGRIGMTFVQYRGHAIISDVYKDSPLAGWVFPSDILIAIDEVPVSGMRVPEIVKLLTARKEHQRALRVISSHAMSELLITDDLVP